MVFLSPMYGILLLFLFLTTDFRMEGCDKQQKQHQNPKLTLAKEAHSVYVGADVGADVGRVVKMPSHGCR